MHCISIDRNEHGVAFSLLEHQSAATIGWLASKIGRRSTTQGILGSTQFGTAAQTLQPVANLQDTSPQLG